jgi:hypothetical protein
MNSQPAYGYHMTVFRLRWTQSSHNLLRRERHGIEGLMIHSKDNIVRPPWGEEMEEALMEQRRRLLSAPSTPRSSHSRVKIAVGIGVVAPLSLLGAWALYQLLV